MTDHLQYLWPALRPSDLTHLTPQVKELLGDVEDASRRLADAYLTTWGQLPGLETRVEFLRHALCRTIFGHDDPGDRRGLIAAGFFLASRLCDEVALAPERKDRQFAERVRALYRDLLDGKEFSFEASGLNIVARVDVREGTRVTSLPRSPELDHAAWEVYVGQPQGNGETRRARGGFGSISAAMWLPCIDNDRRALEGKITPETWVKQWEVLWRRNLFHVLIEPGMPASLRQSFADVAFNMVSMHYQVYRALAERHDLAPFDPRLDIWYVALKNIHAGGPVLTALVAPSTPRDRVLETMRFNAGGRLGGSLHSALDESIMATFARVTECELRHLEARTHKSDRKERVRRLLH